MWIGYGVNVVNDVKLMDYLCDNCIGIESCLISNVLMNMVILLIEYLLIIFLDYGIFVCLNIDDLVV